MASNDKKIKTNPAPKNEAAAKKEAPPKKKDEGQTKDKRCSPTFWDRLAALARWTGVLVTPPVSPSWAG
jgi:hypothetical protein